MKPYKKSSIRIASAALIVLLLSVLILVDTRGSAFLQVTQINVGQGDSAILRDPNGFTILIDGGKTSAGPTLVKTLKDLAVQTIDVMIASHADSDHIGGLISVLQDHSIAVKRVLYNGYTGSTATWDQFASAVQAEGLSLEAVQFPQTLQLGQMTVWVMNPAAGLIDPETNDASVVLKISYGANRFLFTGDIDGSIEATIIARGTPLASDILKVAHHGSAYSSSLNFIASVQPKEAVISVGVNSYGHPSADTIAILETAGARVWRTDQAGSVIVNSDGLTYTILNVRIYDVFIPMVNK
jgi:competence protein ComEC